MVARFTTILIALFYSTFVIGQNLDSLLKAYKNASNPIEKGLAGVHLLEVFANRNTDSAFMYGKASLSSAESLLLENPESIEAANLAGLACFNLAALNHKGSKFEEAKTFYLKAIPLLSRGESPKNKGKEHQYNCY